MILVLLLFVAASCGDDAATTASPTTTAAPTTAAPTTTTVDPTTTQAAAVPSSTASPPTSDLVPSAGDEYIALGSSIASGFGISVQATPCGRSGRNYPTLVAAEFGLELTDVSCGASRIPNVVDTAQGDFPPQIEALSPLTKLITVTVGGNDIGLNGKALACSDPQTICDEPDDLEANIAALRPQLTAMVGTLRASAPDAAIVLVTYPREFPEDNCPELSLDDEELEMLRSMAEELEAAFMDVAANTGVLLVDPYVEPGDHTGCAPEEDRWVAGAVADDGFAFHPTALGHRVMAEMIGAVLRS